MPSPQAQPAFLSNYPKPARSRPLAYTLLTLLALTGAAWLAVGGWPENKLAAWLPGLAEESQPTLTP